MQGRFSGHSGFRPARKILGPVAWLLVVFLPLACATEQANITGQQDDGDAAAASTQAAGANSGDGEKYYDVDCDQVDEEGNDICVTDRGTYVGWRTFHATCHVCHGPNAVGSSFAPGLLKDIDKERFVDVVANGYTGQMGVMPAWGENPNVKDFIDELYAYQQARADGVLEPGRPVRKD